jgi:serpin B
MKNRAVLFVVATVLSLELAMSATSAGEAPDGVKSLVAGNTDFSGMDGNTNRLYVSDVLHQAFVDVNEEGTEAAAATDTALCECISELPSVFRADHPFLFLIQENRSGTILFMGRVTDPTKLL